MSWIYLAVAGLLEIGFAFGMKWSEGFSRPLPAAATAATGIASIWLLSMALRVLPIGTAYAVWTGIGAAGTALVGMALLGESVTAARLACLAMIVAGVAGLRFFAE
jgi:quaternary ammonium compound-resistance protein SugE